MSIRATVAVTAGAVVAVSLLTCTRPVKHPNYNTYWHQYVHESSLFSYTGFGVSDLPIHRPTTPCSSTTYHARGFVCDSCGHVTAHAVTPGDMHNGDLHVASLVHGTSGNMPWMTESEWRTVLTSQA